MGTTLTALLWSGVDGRALPYRRLARPTCSATGSSTRSPTITPWSSRWSTRAGSAPEQAASHPQRSLVMRALQSSIRAEPDLSMLEAKVGDRYLLCSDGLSDVVSERHRAQDADGVHRPGRGGRPADRPRDPQRRPGQHHLRRWPTSWTPLEPGAASRASVIVGAASTGDGAGRRCAATAPRPARTSSPIQACRQPAGRRPRAARDHRRPPGAASRSAVTTQPGRAARTATATQPGMVAGRRARA